MGLISLRPRVRSPYRPYVYKASNFCLKLAEYQSGYWVWLEIKCLRARVFKSRLCRIFLFFFIFYFIKSLQNSMHNTQIYHSKYLLIDYFIYITKHKKQVILGQVLKWLRGQIKALVQQCAWVQIPSCPYFKFLFQSKTNIYNISINKTNW